jgi:hypothetical protein
MTPPIEAIDDFWRWFSDNAHSIAALKGNAVDELDSRVAALGEFAWEIGPAPCGTTSLSISPDGDSERLNETRRIVARAPRVEGWLFFPARQARESAETCVVCDESGVERTVDASTWEFVIYRHSDGYVELLVRPGASTAALSAELVDAATTLVVDAILGEEQRLTTFDVVETVSEWTDRERRLATPITALRGAVERIRRESR